MTDQTESRVCESCRESFGCGANAERCWCFDIDLPDDKAAEIRELYSKCLCPKCLHELSARPAIIVSYPDGKTEIINEAVRVDPQNFHEGMLDFYDVRGNLLRQIGMSEPDSS